MVLLRSFQTSAQTALSENYYYIIITNAMNFSEPYQLQNNFPFEYEIYLKFKTGLLNDFMYVCY